MKVPERIAQAARDRVRLTTGQRARTIEAANAGRPLEAEPDEDRRIQRMQAVAKVDRPSARALIENTAPDNLDLFGERRLGAERIQGKTVDFVGVAFVELAWAASRSVGRVIFRTGDPQGSGFMISGRLFMTNNHVIGSEDAARGFLVQFDYELDADQRAREPTVFELDPAAFFFTSAETDLDFTIVALGTRLRGQRTLEEFGYCPLLDTGDKHVLGELVNVIQHPEGDYKQIVLRENRLVARLDRVLHYVADTQPGSSGSPVLNDQWEVVALHHWGEPFTQTTTPDGRSVSKDVNEGIRISAIVKTLQGIAESLPVGNRKLLEEALMPKTRHPTAPVGGSSAGDRGAHDERYDDDGVAPTAIVDDAGRGGSARRRRRDSDQRVNDPGPVVEDDGTVTWTIPVEISLHVGTPSSGHAAAAVIRVPGRAPAVDAMPERVEIDPRYGSRRGYDPAFLDGFALPLPILSAALRQHAAVNRRAAAGQDRYVLPYHHFSIVLNGERRIAYFTAVNIDGSRSVTVDRTTGEPEAAEASETWYVDPRVAPGAQQDQSLYSRQQPRTFDRGHLVRRQDPNWGTRAQARVANADTFHFTNCSPQHFRFNEGAALWAGLEDYVLDNAKADADRVSVFTGPIFRDDDPAYRSFQVPLQFWKVLMRVEDGRLRATAFVVSQEELLARGLPEGFADDRKVRHFQTSVAHLEQLTGLDFGELRDHDTLGPRGPEAAERAIEIRAFEDLRL